MRVDNSEAELSILIRPRRYGGLFKALSGGVGEEEEEEEVGRGVASR